MTKKCPRCCMLKPVDHFGLKKGNPEHLRSWCKSCEREATKNQQAKNPEKKRLRDQQYYLDHKETIKAQVKQYSLKNPSVKRNSEKKRRAKKKGSTIRTLTSIEWMKLLEFFNYECVYCGRPWEEQDHFIPLSKGGTHTANNVVPSCKNCNRRKASKMPLEFIGCFDSRKVE